MPFSSEFTIRNVVGDITTAGALQQTVNLSIDGAVAAASISVADGRQVSISSIITTAAADASWRLQRTVDGVAWIDCALFNTDVSVDTQRTVTFAVPVEIIGSATAGFRMRVTTPGGAAAVTCSFEVQQQ